MRQSRGSSGSRPSSGKTAERVALIARSTASGAPDRLPGREGRPYPRRSSSPAPGGPAAGAPRAPATPPASPARIERVAGHDREQMGPGPRHDLDQRVPAAAGDHPLAAAQLVGERAHREVARPLPVDGQPQVGQRVEPVRVGAALADEHLRRGTPAARRARPRGTPAASRRRRCRAAAATLTALPAGVRAADLGREAGAREQRHAASRAG